MEFVIVGIICFFIGYALGHRNGFVHGMKQLNKILSIPPLGGGKVRK